jgi:N,N'-diacetylbacillosaminyl-diphospho-undecaprenol alpha-1,3-N-acetylgalactosaminyltransferase
MRIVFLSHLDLNLYRFRLPVMQSLVQEGHEVIALCPEGEFSKRFAHYGILHRSYEIERRSLNPFVEIKTLKAIRLALQELQPDLVHAFTHKPNLYGAFAFSGRVVQTVTGLGSFYTRKDARSVMVRTLINGLYRLSAPRVSRVIFQNRDDQEYFISHKIVPKSKAALVRSSGVDTKHFAPSPPDFKLLERYGLDPKLPIVLMIARVIRDKGVYEYIQATERLKGQAQFLYIGEIDRGNPHAYHPEWKSVRHLGYKENVKEWIALSDLVVLPSYREGVPRTLLEAAAMAKPIVTTDVPGCREVVVDGLNGLLVPPKDAAKLAEAIGSLLLNPQKREKMGAAGRKMAVEEFSVEKVVESYKRIYREILKES